MRFGFGLALAFVSAAFLGNSARGSAVLVANQGFEAPPTTTTVLSAGWSGIGGGGYKYNPYEFRGGDVYYAGANPATDPANGGGGYPGISGENLAYVYADAPGSGFIQTLAATFAANTEYTLTVTELARNGTDAGAFLGSTIQLFAGTTLIASATDTVGPTPGTAKDQIAFLADSNTFAGLVGQALTIKLLTTNTPTILAATDWDNVRLDATTVVTPEPATVLTGTIAAIAGFSLALARRRS